MLNHILLGATLFFLGVDIGVTLCAKAINAKSIETQFGIAFHKLRTEFAALVAKAEKKL